MMVSAVLGGYFQRIPIPVGRRHLHPRSLSLDHDEFPRIDVLEPAPTTLFNDELVILLPRPKRRCLFLDVDVSAGAANDFDFIYKRPVWVVRFHELNGYRKQPVLTSLPQALFDPLPSRQSN